MRYRLLALDVDGTLLDPAGILRPAVRDAVLAVQHRGLQVVLCTGRRFRTARPLAQALQLTGPIVVHNGALVKDLASGQTLHHQYVAEEVYHQALALLRGLSPPMAYVDTVHGHIDIVTERLERAHPFQRIYLAENRAHCCVVADMAQPLPYGVFLMGIMADGPSLQALYPHVAETLGARALVHYLTNKNYPGSILEVLPAGVSKWQALHQLAQHAGIPPEAIVAVGDDRNDIEMIRHAGLGIAMGNAPDVVQAAADVVTSSNAEDGLVDALRLW